MSAATKPYRKKSYHSTVAPMAAANVTLPTEGCSFGAISSPPMTSSSCSRLEVNFFMAFPIKPSGQITHYKPHKLPAAVQRQHSLDAWRSQVTVTVPLCNQI